MVAPRADSQRKDGPPADPPPWTTDAKGAFVDWTAAPYSDGRGNVELVLEGEDPNRIPRDVRMQRIREFYLLTWRAGGMKRPPARRLADSGEYR